MTFILAHLLKKEIWNHAVELRTQKQEYKENLISRETLLSKLEGCARSPNDWKVSYFTHKFDLQCAIYIMYNVDSAIRDSIRREYYATFLGGNFIGNEALLEANVSSGISEQ